MQLNSASNRESLMQEGLSDYVAHLQLHMSLQAKNLVPSDTQLQGNLKTLLQQTQADVEKHASRQSFM